METRDIRSVSAARRYLSIVLLLVAASALTGCVTAGVLKLRKDRETEIASLNEFRTITGIRSAWEGEDGTVFACIEFREDRRATPRPMTIRLSDAPRVGRTYGTFRSNSYPVQSEPDDGKLRRFIYPLRDALPGCQTSVPASGIPIQRISLTPRDDDRIQDFVLSTGFGSPDSDLIFEFTRAEPSFKDVLIAYRPPAERDRRTPFAIAGGFEPRSEWVNPYTLLVAPAIATDALIITFAIMGRGDPEKLDKGLARLLFK